MELDIQCNFQYLDLDLNNQCNHKMYLGNHLGRGHYLKGNTGGLVVQIVLALFEGLKS